MIVPAEQTDRNNLLRALPSNISLKPPASSAADFHRSPLERLPSFARIISSLAGTVPSSLTTTAGKLQLFGDDHVDDEDMRADIRYDLSGLGIGLPCVS